MQFTDSLVNLVTGLGGHRDKTTGSHFVMRPMSRAELDAAYFGDWLAGKIVDAPADDMTREWRTWAGGPRNTAAIRGTEIRLGIRHKVNRAHKMARLYGGSALIMGDGAKDPSKPLDPDRVASRGLKYVHVLSRWELWAGLLDRDPLSEFFGEPLYYEVNTPEDGGVRLHPSRVVRFQGVPWLEVAHTVDGWGWPILDRVHDAVRDVAASQANLALMTHEAKMDVVSIPNLTANVQSAQYRDGLIQRFQLANQLKSTMGVMLLDSSEVWSQKTLDLGTMPDAIRMFLEIVSGGADIPVTRLLGTAPKGMNATGESDLRNYYDMLAAKQEVDVRPALWRMDALLLRDAGLSKNLEYVWNPLWQLTENERAAIGLQKAQMNQIYATMAVAAPSAIRKAIQNQMVADGLWPGLQDALDAAGDEPPGQLIEKAAITAEEIDTPSAKSNIVKADSLQGALPFDANPPAGRVALADAAPRTLSVSRQVLNPRAIRAWAKAQGFATTLRPTDLHVTICYSEAEIDWMTAGTVRDRLVIPAGGPRQMAQFGDAVVLLFSSHDLSNRHQELRSLGASSSHPEYQAHITITYQPGTVDLAKVRPYGGQIAFGPERFEELKTGKDKPEERPT